MKGEIKRDRGDFFPKNVSRPSNPQDELAPICFEKNHRRTNYSSIFPSKVQNLAVYSNSIFWAQGIKSDLFFGRTVHASFVLILLDAPLPQFFIILQGIAGATDVSNFLRAFLMVSLNSVSSGSMK